MKQHATVWVVELFNPVSEQYEPTIGAALIRAEALDDMRYWKTRNPDDRFRVVRYRREGT